MVTVRLAHRLHHAESLRSGGMSRLQAEVYATLMQNLFPDEIPILHSFKLDAGLVDSIAFESTRRLFVSLPAPVVTSVMKTIFNGWATSHRLHEDERLPCLFGCPAQDDSTSHYMQCGQLWRVVSRAFKLLSLTVPSFADFVFRSHADRIRCNLRLPSVST